MSELDLGRALFAMVNNGKMNAQDTQEALYLINRGATLQMVNSEGITTLMCACAGGHTEVVKAMLKSGRIVALEQQDSHGWTALITAAHRSDAATVQALLDAGADHTVKDKMGRDALYYAKGSGDAGKQRALQLARESDAFRQDTTVLKSPVSVRKPLQYKPQ